MYKAASERKLRKSDHIRETCENPSENANAFWWRCENASEKCMLERQSSRECGNPSDDRENSSDGREKREEDFRDRRCSCDGLAMPVTVCDGASRERRRSAKIRATVAKTATTIVGIRREGAALAVTELG